MASASGNVPLEHVMVYTDGACSGNPGPGGWGVLFHFSDRSEEISGKSVLTTNNQMELMAAIAALEYLKQSRAVTLHTDSTYVKDGITKWIKRWKENNWLTSKRKPVKNKALWQRLENAVAHHRVEWVWVRGHAGEPGNERADALARNGIEKYYLT